MKSESDAFMPASSVPREQLEEGIARQIFGYDKSILMARVEFAAGAVGTQHAHPHAQVTYIESGEFEVTIGGQTKVLRAGDAYHISPNIRHGAVCKQAGILIDVFSPMREDFFQSENRK